MFSWRKPHANGVIQISPGSDREAVATPGIDGIALELQGSSTDGANHPETTVLHAVDTSEMWPSFVELTSEFWSHLPFFPQGGGSCLALPWATLFDAVGVRAP
jgi:hypothetical protein